MSLGSRDHITPALRQLHWLPVVSSHIQTLLINARRARRPLFGLHQQSSDTNILSRRYRLRSAAGNRFELPAIHHKFDDRAFSHAGPVAWNNLSPHITAIKDIETFKTSLNTYLFKLVYCQ